MPRSSRHKSSKHSSRDTRDYSDSEDDSGLRERRGGGEEGGSRVSKDSGFSEKRRVEAKDSKDVYGSRNGDYAEDHGSSKRRKEKFSDGVSDRWNGGDDEGSNRAKSSGESKSRRRDDENEDARRSGKSERHRESSRKDGRESERKERERRADKLDEKQEIATDSRVAAASESENIPERRTRKRRESFHDMGKYQGDAEDVKERHAYSGDDAARVGKQNDEKLRDEYHRDKHREEVNKDSDNRYEKQKDDYPAKDRNLSRSSEKYLRDEKERAEIRPRKSKPHESNRDINPSREHNHYRVRDRDGDRERDSNRDHDHDLDWDHDCDGNRDLDRDREWVQDHERDCPSAREKERDRDWERVKGRDHDRKQCDHDRDRDYDDQNVLYKYHRGKKRSSEDCDDYHDSKLRDAKARSFHVEKRSLSSSRVEEDDRGRSQPRQEHLNDVPGSSRSRASPTSSSHGEIDEYRHEKDGRKYRDSSKESRSRAISPRESAGFSGLADKGSKYTPLDKQNKSEDGHFGEISAERSLGSKASPRGLTERSPSSTSLERSRHTCRTSIRRNLDSEETGRRSIGPTDGRDFSSTEGRPSRETSMGRHAVDEYFQADPSFNSKSGPSNTSFRIPPQPPRRNNDHNLGRGHGNNWRGVPNWSSPVPNGFIPFQHGPPHGNFPAIMPHFPPPLFGVRPPMEVNQSGLPYHTADVDGFPGHLRPIGWQNMIDTSGLPRFHGWERSGLLREDPHLYQGPDWDQNRNIMNLQGWETNSDPWKGQNGDSSADLPSSLKKEEHRLQVPGDDYHPRGNGSTSGNSDRPMIQARSPGGRQELPPTSDREVIKSPPPKTDTDLGPDSSKSAEVNALAQLSRAYLSKLDISAELADPQLYEQCQSLLGSEHSVADEIPAMHIVLEGHGNAMQENRDGSLRGSLFPATDVSVLQKAMNHYKKQRLERWSSIPPVNLGPLDFNRMTNGDAVHERDRALSKDGKGKVMEDIDEKMPDAPHLTFDEMNMETPKASSPPERKLEDPLVITSDKVAPHSADALCQNEIEGEGEPVDDTIQLVGDGEAVSVAQAPSGNATGISLVKYGSDDEGLGATMPNESKNNESKMANLSRIHQSPESTH